MSVYTRFLGDFAITPPLNEAETEYLRAFAAQGGPIAADPYAVAMNPRFAHNEFDLTDTDLRRDRPDIDWEPSVDGSHLQWDEGDSFGRGGSRAITYLLEHFLLPGAHAARDGRDEFSAFTFDHEVYGVAAMTTSDSPELYLVVAQGNRLQTVAITREQFGHREASADEWATSRVSQDRLVRLAVRTVGR